MAPLLDCSIARLLDAGGWLRLRAGGWLRLSWAQQGNTKEHSTSIRPRGGLRRMRELWRMRELTHELQLIPILLLFRLFLVLQQDRRLVLRTQT